MRHWAIKPQRTIHGRAHTLGAMVEALLTRIDDIPGAKRKVEGAASLCSNAMETRREDGRKRGRGRTNIRGHERNRVPWFGGGSSECDWKCKMRRRQPSRPARVKQCQSVDGGGEKGRADAQSVTLLSLKRGIRSGVKASAGNAQRRISKGQNRVEAWVVWNPLCIHYVQGRAGQEATPETGPERENPPGMYRVLALETLDSTRSERICST